MSTVEILDDAAAVHALSAEWHALAVSCAARHSMFPFWCLPWWQHLGHGQLLVVTVRAGRELVGLAPLHVRRRGPVRVARFLGHGLGPVGELLIAPGHPEVAAQLWDAVLTVPGVYLELTNFAETGGGLEHLVSRGDRNLHIAPSDTCPFVVVDGSFDTYFEGRSGELHRILRRSGRALERRGSTFTVDVVRDEQGVNEVLPAVTGVFDAAEEHQPRLHLLAPPYADFTRKLLRAAAAADALQLFVGRIDDEVVAFALTLGCGPSIAMWLNRFHPSASDVGPGHLVFKEMVRYGFEHGLEEVDFMLGDFRYKWLWCSDAARTVTVTGARGHLASIVGRASLAAASAVAGFARRS